MTQLPRWIAPSFVIRTALQQAAWDKGYRLDQPPVGEWLSFGSTTASGRIWLAGSGDNGPWWLSSDHPGVVAEFGPGEDVAGPGLAVYAFAGKRALYDSLDRAYRLGVSLPNVPLAEFERETSGLPRETVAERLVLQRVGQDVFRRALLQYWEGRCAVTGITEGPLLRASHILPWADCATDADRLDVNNGLLLSAMWDAAFDAHLVSFTDEGVALYQDDLSDSAMQALGADARMTRPPSPAQRAFLSQHRCAFQGR